MFGGLAGIGKAALQGALSGAGGEAGRNILPLSNNPTAATLAGVLAGQTAAGGLYGLAGRGINAARGIGNPIVSAYDTAGITPQLAGDVTGRPSLQALQSLAMRAPFGGRAIHAAQTGADEFGNAIENYASQFGRSETPTQAGMALQENGRNWMGQFRQAQEQAEQAVSAKVPGTSIVSMDPVKDVLNETISKMPDAPHVAAMMTNPVFQGLSGALGKDLRGPQPYLNDPLYATSGTVPLPVPARPGFEWDTARAWRTKVGEQLEMSLVSRDGNDAAWKRIYGALSGALGDTATKAGAGSEWQAANAITNQGHNFIENTLSNIINHPGAQNSITPETAANYALRGTGSGGTTLNDLRSAMPDAVNELAAYKLRDMAAATPGRMTQDQPTSATTFSTELNRLSPEARTALFGSYSPMLDALQTVAERGKETYQRFGNPSGTASTLQHANLFTAPRDIALAAMGGHEVGGMPGAVLGGASTGVGYLAGPALANLTAREALTRYLAAPTGGPGVGASRLYRAAGAGSALAPLLATPGEHAR
jgi:nucleotide-binding universal stress UspA family protein